MKNTNSTDSVNRLNGTHPSIFFEATLSAISECVCVFNRDCKFVYANRAIQQFFEVETEMPGKSFEDLDYGVELVGRLNHHIDTVFETGKTIEDEVLYTRSTGVNTYLSFTLNPSQAESGAIELVVGVFRDVTEKRQLEETLAVNTNVTEQRKAEVAWLENIPCLLSNPC